MLQYYAKLGLPRLRFRRPASDACYSMKAPPPHWADICFVIARKVYAFCVWPIIAAGVQVGAGLRSRLASDDSLHERALDILVKVGLEGDELFLSSPVLQDEDDRGFHLLHHAATFGNINKVQ